MSTTKLLISIHNVSHCQVSLVPSPSPSFVHPSPKRAMWSQSLAVGTEISEVVAEITVGGHGIQERCEVVAVNRSGRAIHRKRDGGSYSQP